jgi:hypothetical protein
MNWTLKHIWIDNETKFSEELFIKWLQNHRIKYEFIVFYEHEQNSDWKSNKLLITKAKTIIFNSKISKTL